MFIRIAAVSLLFSSVALAQKVPNGHPVMWRKPASTVKPHAMFWGSGGEIGKPVGPFKFIEENMNGTNPKIKVVDSRGVKWGVKFDEEVHAEIAANRLFWAAGYRVDDVYFVPSGVVSGVTGPQRAGSFIDSRGRFKNARFSKKYTLDGATEVKSHSVRWKWDSNPFLNTKELSGLKIMNALVANFDTKSDNNSIQSARYSDGRTFLWYMVDDIGGTFGRADAADHSKWKLSEYAADPFLSGASGGHLHVDHPGKNSESFRSVPLEHARWLCDQICGLSQSQLEDLFRASISDSPNAPLNSTAKGYVAAVAKRLKRLEGLAGRGQQSARR